MLQASLKQRCLCINPKENLQQFTMAPCQPWLLPRVRLGSCPRPNSAGHNCHMLPSDMDSFSGHTQRIWLRLGHHRCGGCEQRWGVAVMETCWGLCQAVAPHSYSPWGTGPWGTGDMGCTKALLNIRCRWVGSGHCQGWEHRSQGGSNPFTVRIDFAVLDGGLPWLHGACYVISVMSDSLRPCEQ